MKTTITESKSTERVLELEIEREKFDKIFEQKVKKYSKEVRINGFRPGQVPKDIVAKRFKDPINAESLEALVDEAIKEACKENNIEPIAQGRIEKLENEAGKPIYIKAIMEVDAPVVVKDYKLDIPIHTADITDAQVDEQIVMLRRRKGEETKVDRATALGDIVIAEYLQISLAGEDQSLPNQKEFRMEIGVAGSIPEMDRAMLGAKAGEKKDVSFTFPADHRQVILAGKQTEYKLLVKEVNEVKLPEVNDVFAQEYGFDSLEILRDRISEDLGKQALQSAKEKAYEEAMIRLMDINSFDVPKARIQNYVNYKLKEQGHVHDGDDHGHDHSDLEAEAVFNIRRFRILEEIAKIEKIKATSEEVDQRLHELAEQYGTDFETLKTSLRKSGKINEIREEIKSEKTLDFVIGFKRESALAEVV